MITRKSNAHLKKGKTAEERACVFLQQQGLKLLNKNFRCFSGEIDLIMQDKDHVVFVEVRTRNRTDYGDALESITPAKVQKLIRTATLYLQKQKWLYRVNTRFDVVVIHPVKGEMKLEWIPDAFRV